MVLAIIICKPSKAKECDKGTVTMNMLLKVDIKTYLYFCKNWPYVNNYDTDWENKENITDCRDLGMFYTWDYHKIFL